MIEGPELLNFALHDLLIWLGSAAGVSIVLLWYWWIIDNK